MTDAPITPLSDDEVAAGFGSVTPIATAAAVPAIPATVTPPTDQEFQDLVQLPGVGDVDLVTADKAAAPQLTQAADGTYHLVLTWTKATKAHVGAAVAAIVGLGEVATTYVLPAGSPYTTWAQVALGAVGLVGVWLGVYLPTNKAKAA